MSPAPEYEFELEVFIDIGGDPAAERTPGTMQGTDSGNSSPGPSNEQAEEGSARRRLHNLGYTTGEPLGIIVKAFQHDCQKKETGELKDIEDELKQRHDSCNPPLRS